MQREEGAPKRFWARHKTQAVLRLLRGEDIDLVSRELGVTARRQLLLGTDDNYFCASTSASAM